MATESVATAPREFWGLNGKYQIAPETNHSEMANDAGCLLEASEANLEAVIDALEDEGGNIVASPRLMASMLYGVRYQMQMAHRLVWAMDAKHAEEAKRRGGN